MKFESEFYHFHSRKCNLKMSSAKMAGVGGLGVGVWLSEVLSACWIHGLV